MTMAETTNTTTSNSGSTGTSASKSTAARKRTATPRRRTTTRTTAARKASNKATAARGARTSAQRETAEAAQANARAAKATARQGQATAERFTLIGVGATLEARDRVVEFVTDWYETFAAPLTSREAAEKSLRKFERRGTTERNRIERRAKKARTRVERELPFHLHNFGSGWRPQLRRGDNLLNSFAARDDGHVRPNGSA